MKINEVTPMIIKELSNNLEDQKGKKLEEIAQNFVKKIFNEFSESIALIRIFITIPYGELPGNLQKFASDLASTADLKLDQESFILTLFGTSGIENNWNSRKTSQGHKAIPLASSEFVAAIPMISALLEQLGFDLGWIRGEQEIIAKKMGKMGGTFYVPDASSTKDSKDRLIIAGQDYVKQYNIKTVFGVGGGYLITNKFVTLICFLKDQLEKKQATYFQGLINLFKTLTSDSIKDKELYFL